MTPGWHKMTLGLAIMGNMGYYEQLKEQSDYGSMSKQTKVNDIQDECHRCLYVRNQDPVGDILNQTSSSNCRLNFPSNSDFKMFKSALWWLFPRDDDKWGGVSESYPHSTLGGDGSRSDLAINHPDLGDISSCSVFSVRSYFRPSGTIPTDFM